MAKTLDFNIYEPPTLPLVMRDPEKTKIDVTAPTEGLLEELVAIAPELDERMASTTVESIKANYELAARLMSHNLQGITVTALDLRDKYKLTIWMLKAFYNQYFDFLGEIGNEKN